MRKLLLVIPTLDRSGAEKQFTLLATRLPRDEFDVHAVALTRGGPYEKELADAGIPLTVLHKRLKFNPVTLWRLRRLIANQQPDIVHTWLFAANAYGRLAAGRSSAKFIVSERCVDSWKSGWQLKLDRRLLPRTAKMVANSKSVQNFYADQGVPGELLTVIPNGIETRGDRATRDERNQALAEFDIPADAHVVGYVGRLARQKRGRDLIWALQILRQLRPNIYFLIVGDGPEAAELKALARHFGCDSLIRFLGHRADAARITSLLDVAWLASDFEGMSNSVMEAMAWGVPVVATDIAPNRELVIDGETGFLVKVGDSTGFAQFADRILADAELSARLGNAARERMRAEFSVEKMVEAHIALYREVAG